MLTRLVLLAFDVTRVSRRSRRSEPHMQHGEHLCCVQLWDKINLKVKHKYVHLPVRTTKYSKGMDKFRQNEPENISSADKLQPDLCVVPHPELFRRSVYCRSESWAPGYLWRQLNKDAEPPFLTEKCEGFFNFCFKGISGLLLSYRWVRLSWKDFFLLLLLPFFSLPTSFSLWCFIFIFCLLNVCRAEYEFYNAISGHNGYYSGQWRIMH